MTVSMQEITVSEPTMRISRIVSVILNGVALQKLARQNDHDVDAMAENLMLNLSNVVKNNIPVHELHQVNSSLRTEIDRRISQLPQAE